MIAFASKGPVDELIRANPWIIPVFVVCWFWLIAAFIARLSGWSQLAERYPANAPSQGPTWRFQSAIMRYGSHFNNCLTFAADPQGLHIAMFVLLRLEHPPILVPWGELTIEPKRRWMMDGYEMRFRQCPGVFMWVRQELGSKIVRASQEAGTGLRLAPQIG